jgi:hypothetical protein
MGIFSMYMGLLYNETFSVPMNLCGTNYVSTSIVVYLVDFFLKIMITIQYN